MFIYLFFLIAIVGVQFASLPTKPIATPKAVWSDDASGVRKRRSTGWTPRPSVLTRFTSQELDELCQLLQSP